jgi:hypothetical protein
MEKEQVTEILEYAIEQLKKNDSVLFDLNVSERALMFHMARYIRDKTPVNLNVDCEYNRHLTDVKTLHYLKRKLGVETKSDVFPDILIHERNSDKNNILVVELKKCDGDLNQDIEKLKAFKKEPYSYTFAVQIVFNNEANLTFKFIE